MNTDGDKRQLMLLLAWMSPAFPTGSFAYSHGLEWEIARGAVRDGPSLKEWIANLLTQGSGWNDAVLFGQCWEKETEVLNELALALAASRERWLETTQLGRAFANAANVFSPLAWGEDMIAYPIAAGSACQAMGIVRDAALTAYLQGFATALVSVAVRLVPIGQTQGLEVMRELMPLIAETAERAAQATLDDLGSATIGAEIAAMRHETLATRVFRT
jgi:urease accessory protein